MAKTIKISDLYNNIHIVDVTLIERLREYTNSKNEVVTEVHLKATIPPQQFQYIASSETELSMREKIIKVGEDNTRV